MPSTKQALVGTLGLGLTLTGLSFALAPSPAHAVGGVFISEFHYDNTGGDVGEFVEVTAPAGTDLTGYSIVLYNGNGGGTYDTKVLSGTVANQQDGWGTAVINYPSNGIQNGGGTTPDEDGLALINPSNAVVEFLSYEGAFVATAGPANGQTSTDIGVSEAGTEPTGLSLQRLENNTWTGPATHGSGTPNGYNTGGGPAELAGVSEPDAAATVNEPMTAVVLEATGGTPPYTWSTASTLPAGVSLSSGGELSGTPTETGTFPVTATVTDDAAATADVSFTLTVTAAGARPIAEVQGTGPRSPFAPATGTGPGQTVNVEGVVTAVLRDPYPAELGTTGGMDGIYVQTAGTGGTTDATPEASDAIFVYGSPDGSRIPAGVAIGDSVSVTGAVSEFNGTSQISPASASDVVELETSLAPVTGLQIAYPTTEVTREAQEGMLLEPTNQLTVSNVFNTNRFGEVGLATGTEPLKQPTEYFRDDDPANLSAVKAENAERAVILDDGTSVDYFPSRNPRPAGGYPEQDLPLPWLGAANPPRVGARATLQSPVILGFAFNAWRFYPTAPVIDAGASVATFEDTRAANLAPQSVGGDLQIATFNVLNYFNTTGQQYVANGAAQNPPVNTQCSYFLDREDNPIGNNTCGIVTNGNNAGNGPRGAATTVSFQRQQAKMVVAINALDADIIGLEEVENSMKLVGETNRDDAVASIVAALNAAAGSNKWAYVKSPGEALAATAISEQDVIRPAFIYQRATVRPVGSSDILFGTTQFANAREPLAQAFKPADAANREAFAVIVNHFKSKGDSNPPATGDNANNPDTGAFNGDRTRQATRLAEFAQEFADARDIEAIFLAGDFNAYTQEDPMHALYDAGFDVIDSTDAADETYSFGGLSGSLDHFLGNDAAVAMVTGADVWEINADESVAFQYSRFNYNVTDFWQPSNPFGASDHNPGIVGIDVPDYTSDTTTQVQILGTNDFHGRLLPSGQEGGAAVLSGAVKELQGEYPNTVFAAAGDLVGASTFESFIQDDKPTIDALNAAGLDVSAAGNHEFDQGYEDFVDRIMAPYDPDTNPRGGAEWEYIAANVIEPAGRNELADSWIQPFGDIKVGFVGAVTEDLPSLVSPAGIEGVSVTDIVDATNAAAIDLKADGADIVVLLVHEGSPSTDCASANFTDPSTVWGNITQNVSADVDAIISGHTHLAYNCSFTVQDWVDDGRTVTKRPVVSSGQYGSNLNQLVFSVDDATDEVVATSQDVIGLGGVGWTPDPAVAAIVTDAVNQANTLGAVKLGEIQAPFNRAKLSSSSENRGGESTLGNLVAEVQRWATDTQETGSAEIAFMNPGGLRADMGGTVNGSVRDLSYKQAAVVQPFANTLVNMDLTGHQLETALEQQWQRTSGGTVPSRPFLRLGASEGFTYTYVETPVTVSGVNTFQGEVTGMWLDGEPIDPDATYSVTVNSFLASGGDNFFEFANGTSRADTGKVDLEAMVDYMAAFAPAGSPLPVDYSQRAVEVEFPAGAPETYAPGDTVSFDVSSWTMSTADDVKDTAIQVKLGDTVLDPAAPLNNTIGTAVYDAYGTASVSVVLPATTPGGDATLELIGTQTGTKVLVPLSLPETAPGKPTGATTTPQTPNSVEVSFTAPDDGGSAITGYRAKCVSDDGGVTRYGDAPASPVTVTGLSGGHRYRCTVKAENAIGWGVYSAYSPWVMLDPGAPGRPTGVTVAENSGSEVAVSFTAPVDDGGASITTYRARCVSSDGGDTRSKDGAASPLTVTGLTGTKTYECQVKAMNSVGWGTYSAWSDSFTLAASPPARITDATALSTGGTSAEVSFTAPFDGGEPITLYRTKCVSSDGGVTKYADGSGSPLAVSGLTAGKTYQCTVKAQNSIGWSIFSPYSPAFFTP